MANPTGPRPITVTRTTARYSPHGLKACYFDRMTGLRFDQVFVAFNEAANPVDTEGLVITRAAEDFGGVSADSHVGRWPVISLFETNPVDENLLLIYGQSEPRFSAFSSKWNALKPMVES